MGDATTPAKQKRAGEAADGSARKRRKAAVKAAAVMSGESLEVRPVRI